MPEASRWRRAAEELAQLRADPFRGEIADVVGVSRHRGKRVGLDGQTHLPGDPRSTNEAQRVLVEARVRVADGTEQAGIKVGASIRRVDQPRRSDRRRARPRRWR